MRIRTNLVRARWSAAVQRAVNITLVQVVILPEPFCNDLHERYINRTLVSVQRTIGSTGLCECAWGLPL